MLIIELSALVPQSLLSRSGSVFYSGRKAFSLPSRLYILGLNPGGCPVQQASETLQWHTSKVLETENSEWSAYCDERWRGKPAGADGMQPRVLHLLRNLNLDPRHVPASNVIFVRSARENESKHKFNELAQLCWPFYQTVIERLNVQVVLCFGEMAGGWVCKQLGAGCCVAELVENNNRRWRSRCFVYSKGIAVVVATQPSRADWTAPASDPTPLISRVLTGA